MSAAVDPPRRIGVIDLGSNSLRLVVFERVGAAVFAVLNEKVMCGLARGIAATGRLDRAGLAPARVNLRRFTALARAVGVDHLAVLATAAVRDASDGQAFADEIARECDVPVKILKGPEEAYLSAAGVVAGIPAANGVIGDLGAGSIELAEVGPEPARGGGSAAIGAGVSLPLGPLRLAEFGGSPRTIAEAVETAFFATPPARAAAGRSLYLVGGAARAIARLHMEHVGYPLHIVHQYGIGRGEAEGFFEIVGRLSRKTVERIATIPRKRLETVPLAAFILRRLIAVAAPRRVVFSAFGLREGYAWSLLGDGERRQDPLIAACAALGRKESRFAPDGKRLLDWASPLFPELSRQERRLHLAACWLADIAWSEHPDYRAEQAFARSLRLPFPAFAHADRAFVAAVLHSRYGGAGDHPVRAATDPLIEPETVGAVPVLGAALRLAYTLSGGAVDLLSVTRIGLDGGSVVLDIPPGGLFDGETVQRRLDALGRVLGRPAILRRTAGGPRPLPWDAGDAPRPISGAPAWTQETENDGGRTACSGAPSGS
jgi:exopolyphosphatase/guanosine-5'-triphosphate,3'-diphosphate pyrophosphatase